MAELTKQDIKEVVIGVIDPFAKAVQKDFDRVNGRLDTVDGRLGRVEQRLDNVERDVAWMKEHTSELFKKLDDLISLFKRHEEEIAILSAQVRELTDRVAKLETRR